jgi:hypothetical protein
LIQVSFFLPHSSLIHSFLSRHQLRDGRKYVIPVIEKVSESYDHDDNTRRKKKIVIELEKGKRIIKRKDR